MRSGTPALRWLVAHWSDISSAQQDEAIRLVPELASLQGVGSRTRLEPGLARLDAPQAVLAATRPAAYYAALAQSMADEIEARVQLHLGLTVVAHEGRTQQAIALADTGVYNAQGGITGQVARCVITVSAVGAAESIADLEDTIGHEVWHCYQGQIRGLAWYWAGQPDWLVEGQAEWVGDALRPGQVANSAWSRYVTVPSRSLFARSYDALGFYAHLTQAGVPTWDVLIPMLKADDDAARFAASGALSDRVLDTWASSQAREPAIGAAWELEGPGLPDTRGPARPVLAPANGTTVPFGAAPYTNRLFSLSSAADIVTFAVSGHVRLGDQANGQEFVLAGSSFCTKSGGCTCPPTTTRVGVPPNPLSAETVLAVTGGPDGARGTVTGRSLDEICKPSTSGQVWSMVLWSPDLGDAYPPLLVAYTCHGLESTWKAIYLPSIDGPTRTFEMAFDVGRVSHLAISKAIPRAGTSPPLLLEYAVDFTLEPNDPPVIRVTGTKTEKADGRTYVFAPREFGSDAPLVLKNVSLETQLKPYPAYQHPFRAQALAECGR